ncbi:diguanylate cyclase [uncultured Gammaproteobacteria bacterium]
MKPLISGATQSGLDPSAVDRAVHAEERLLQAAYLDPVTNLYSRRLISAIIEEQIVRARRDARPFAVVDIDLERFRLINTTFGANFGDSVLREVAARLSRHIGDADSIARVAADEFLLVLPGRVRGIALDRVLSVLLQDLTKHPLTIDGQEIFVSARVGVAVFPEDGGTVADLIARASRDLVRPGGRERVVEDRELFQLETGLHRALTDGELHPFYQPQVDLHSGRVMAAESLLRWLRPDQTMISPAVFIPLAETTGLIGPVSTRVMERVLLDLDRWIQQGLRAVPLAINLSARLFSDTWFDQTLLPLLDAGGIPPSHIKFELTETALLEDADRTRQAMKKVRDRGFSFALDDFGTGYSSLSHLHRFPIDEIKIDKSFITGIADNPREQKIVASMINLAHALDITVVAEGIETSEQLSLLRGFGCDLGQGFLFDPALSAGEFAIRLDAVHNLSFSPPPDQP